MTREETLAMLDQTDPALVLEWLAKAHPYRSQPVANVRWVPIEKVHANDYNPNSVATTEMRLLYTSILHDGYTQPVVTVYDAENDRYVIVDGFHRYATMKNNPDIAARTNGHQRPDGVNRSS